METKKFKILAIDDNQDNLIVLNALLEVAFPLAVIITAQSGKTGIELCHQHKPDLILLDIVMPIMDGYEVCHTLKTDEAFKNIPIVMITAARADREGRFKAIEAGADGFLTKPLDEPELITQVRAMLRIKEAEDQKLNEKEKLEKLVKERTDALLSELSERKKAEEKLQLSYLKLEESKQDVMNLIKNLEHEIVERKKIEIAQNETNRKYSDAQRIAHIGSWEENLITGESYWSEETYRIYGITPGTHIFWSEVKKRLPPDDLAYLDNIVDTALKDSNLYNVDYSIIHPELGIRYIHDECEVVRDEHNKAIKITGTSHDITERKRAELIQKVLYSISYAVLTTKDLEELSEFIRMQLGQLIDTTNFCIAYYDENTGLLTPQYIADQKNTMRAWPADRSLTGHVIKNNKSFLVKKEEILEMNRIGDIDLIGALSEVWLGVPLREEGKAIGAFILQNYQDANAYTVKDLELLEFVSHQVSISIQRKKGLQNLVIALEKAEESDKLKTAFLSNMSHEIRSPMNGILGFSELLDDDNITSEERRKFLDIINTNGQHLLSIINDILDIARIDSNQLVVNNTDFNLNQMLEDLWISYENSKTSMGKEQITILYEKDGNDAECILICDEVRLRQILYNLLGNALKFTKAGFIKFGYKQLDDKLQFYVQDTGIGISKENQSLVFERFRQEEETYTRQFGGTGLGLSISKNLAELLGGEMWMESEQGVGSTFYFTIPYK